MKLRFTVRKHPKWNGYFYVWDRLENRIRGHVRWHKPDVIDQCRRFNEMEKAVKV